MAKTKFIYRPGTGVQIRGTIAAITHCKEKGIKNKKDCTSWTVYEIWKFYIICVKKDKGITLVTFGNLFHRNV